MTEAFMCGQKVWIDMFERKRKCLENLILDDLILTNICQPSIVSVNDQVRCNDLLPEGKEVEYFHQGSEIFILG